MSYFFIDLELNFSSKSYWKGEVIISNSIWDSISMYAKLFYTIIQINQPQIQYILYF